MMVVVVMMVVAPIMVVVVVMMVVILSHYNWLFFSNSGIAALVLSPQNLLCIRDGIQQLGERLGGLQQVGLAYRGCGGCLRAAKESER